MTAPQQHLTAYRVDLEPYLVWSHEHAAWWAPGAGYTTRISHARRFTRAQAVNQCINALPGSRAVPNELPVREADAVLMVRVFRNRFAGRCEQWE